MQNNALDDNDAEVNNTDFRLSKLNKQSRLSSSLGRVSPDHGTKEILRLDQNIIFKKIVDNLKRKSWLVSAMECAPHAISSVGIYTCAQAGQTGEGEGKTWQRDKKRERKEKDEQRTKQKER